MDELSKHRRIHEQVYKEINELFSRHNGQIWDSGLVALVSPTQYAAVVCMWLESKCAAEGEIFTLEEEHVVCAGLVLYTRPWARGVGLFPRSKFRDEPACILVRGDERSPNNPPQEPPASPTDLGPNVN